MAASESNNDFIVWGFDQTAYGPVELPTLVNWVRDERVTEESWVFARKNSVWRLAPEVSELQLFFHKKAAAAAAGSAQGLDTRSLRRIKILATFSEEQLQRFVKFVEIQEVPQFTQVVKQGDPGDAMYLVLQGEVRVRLMVDGKETILATLAAGEFFGDIALFDEGPRSADVIANVNSVLGRISVVAFERLAKEAPDLAAPLLRAIGRTLTARIRADNKRHGDSVRLFGG
jgi:hypothetical protein